MFNISSNQETVNKPKPELLMALPYFATLGMQHFTNIKCSFNYGFLLTPQDETRQPRPMAGVNPESPVKVTGLYLTSVLVEQLMQ